MKFCHIDILTFGHIDIWHNYVLGIDILGVDILVLYILECDI